MSTRLKLVRYGVGLCLSIVPLATVHAEPYIGGAFGAGGADVPVGNYASGYRGALRLFAGYEFSPNFALEATTIDLGVPDDQPAGTRESTIGGIGAAAVGTLPTGRWRFSGSLGLMSMDGRADGAADERSWQGILWLAVGFDVTPNFSLGLETGATQVKFGAPVSESAHVHWSALTLAYRFR